ncbi:hypothetical protein AVEN_131002-1 [Araneus ventricosus]|uniref:Uncharacterized protein n=1 Tax=Araneus ventricosus TaxID=182803 RepID=A0A4Y2QFX2_ARAVE|nr:hypothetical protein AVEN_105208-1 [Araneus ventricosus]GBN61388.1 hypothetical protein AVEN_131002-1 [Araneus ventricosus]
MKWNFVKGPQNGTNFCLDQPMSIHRRVLRTISFVRSIVLIDKFVNGLAELGLIFISSTNERDENVWDPIELSRLYIDHLRSFLSGYSGTVE